MRHWKKNYKQLRNKHQMLQGLVSSDSISLGGGFEVGMGPQSRRMMFGQLDA